MFRLVVYEQWVALLQRGNWRTDESVRRFVGSTNTRIMGWGWCEGGLNRQKNSIRYANRRGKIETAFGARIEKCVCVCVGRADDALLMRNMALGARVFEPTCIQVSLKFAEISTARARAPWRSREAEGLPIPFVGMLLLLLRIVKLRS